MTEIKVDKNNENCFVSVKGHNKDSKICAMISTLVATLEGYLKNKFNDNYFYLENDGECRFTVPIGAYDAVEMFSIGVMRIEATFPDNVKADINI